MMNLGGPQTTQDVEKFLTRLFSDREIFKLPMQHLAGPLLAKRRAPEVAKQYALIGGGSPIRKWTDAQGKAMTDLLDKISPETAPHKHYIAFRYANPLTNDAIQAIQEDGVKRLVAFTQYPQYSCTTTGSSLNELYRQLKSHDMLTKVNLSVIDRWGTHPGLVKAFAKLIQQEIEQFPPEERDKIVLLFSAHSIPHRVVDRGDPYPAEVAKTVGRVMDELHHNHPYRLIWQSKVGPLPWLGPHVPEVLQGYARQGVKHFVIIPIAFTSDHIETLFELDITYGKLANELGLKLRRAQALNLEPLFIEALANIVHGHLKQGHKASKQLHLKCPGCDNNHCGESKAYFCSQPVGQMNSAQSGN